MSYSFRSVTRTARSLALLAAVVGVTGAIPRTASADAVITAGADKKVKIWNAADGALIKSIDAPDGVVSVMALSPNGKVLATGGADKKVKLWNAEDGSLIKSIDAHEGAVTSLAFNADGKKLISGGADKKVFIWDAADGKKLSTIGGIEAAIVNIFSLAEMTITGAADGKVKIVDKVIANFKRSNFKTMTL